MAKLHKNQQGVVSMIVSITIMIIISLIVISFARLMRTEQEQALDRQLSAQAYYAAEAAVNDAREAFFAGEIVGRRDECQTDTGPLSQSELLSGGISEYVCVTVDSQPNTLVYDDVGVDRSTVTEIRAFDDAGTPRDISSITIGWEDPEGGTRFAGSGFSLPTHSEWSNTIDPGLLRIDLIPLPTSGFTRDYLRENTQVLFLYPSENGDSTFSWPATPRAQDQAQFVGDCTDTPSDTQFRRCEATITDLPLGAGDSYLLRMRSSYSPSSVTISAFLSSSNQLASFGDAQLVIDATGQSSDVTRRVEERLPLEFTYDFPEYALDIAADLCKRLNITDGVTNSTIVDPSVRSISACQP